MDLKMSKLRNIKNKMSQFFRDKILDYYENSRI